MIRIVVADDHPVVREGLKRVVGDAPDMRVVGEARSGDEALACLDATPADVLLTDLSMPGPGFQDLLANVRARHPRLAVLVISVHPEEPFAIHALRAGAAGYLTKDHEPARLLEAIRRVGGGRRYVSPALAERLTRELAPDSGAPPHRVLSSREFEVLRHIAAGASTKEIAIALGVSAKTVSTHRSHIIEKLGVSSNAGLVRYAVEHGLVD